MQTRWTHPRTALWHALSLAGLLVLSACQTSEPTPTPPPDTGGNGGQPTPAVEGGGSGGDGPTSITIASSEQTNSFWMIGNEDTDQSGLVHAALVAQNVQTTEYYPVLVEEIPTEENGGWVINPDGSMVTTYTLREGLTWHDGTPLAAADFVFAYNVSNDDNMPINDRVIQDFVESVEAPDDRTFVINWHTTYKWANRLQRADHISPLPRHILEDQYNQAVSSGNYDPFINSPFWNSQWVGVGPYKMVDYGEGTLIELEAFDNYALGRPNIDRIFLRPIADPNAALTGFLTGELDVSWGAVDMQGAQVLQGQWAEGEVEVYPISSRYVGPSLNPWFDDVRVSRALMHAIDREALNEAVYNGLSEVMHFPMNPNHPMFDQALEAATIYEYDPDRAGQLLDEAGWTMGPDGVRVNDQGERFEFEFRVETGETSFEQFQVLMMDWWGEIGVIATPANLPQRLFDAEENRNRWPGVGQNTGNVNTWEWPERWHSNQIPTAENRWVGGNVCRWDNAEKNAVLDEMSAIIPDEREEELMLEFVRLWTEELPCWSLVYSPDIKVVSSRVEGPTSRVFSGGNGSNSWNVHEWEVVE